MAGLAVGVHGVGKAYVRQSASSQHGTNQGLPRLTGNVDCVMFPSKVSDLTHLRGLWCAFYGVVFSIGGTIASGVIVWANIAHPNTILFTGLGKKEC